MRWQMRSCRPETPHRATANGTPFRETFLHVTSSVTFASRDTATYRWTMGSRRKAVLENAVAQVRQIYTELANRPLDRNCVRLQECCHFKLTGRTPYLTKGEALLAAKALRSTGRKRMPEGGAGMCPLLDRGTGNCLIYRDRPFGCRTFDSKSCRCRANQAKLRRALPRPAKSHSLLKTCFFWTLCP